MFRDFIELRRGIGSPAALPCLGPTQLGCGQRMHIFVGERIDENAIGDAENSSAGTDAEREREDRGECEAWISPQLTGCITKVLPDCFQAETATSGTLAPVVFHLDFSPHSGRDRSSALQYVSTINIAPRVSASGLGDNFPADNS